MAELGGKLGKHACRTCKCSLAGLASQLPSMLLMPQCIPARVRSAGSAHPRRWPCGSRSRWPGTGRGSQPSTCSGMGGTSKGLKRAIIASKRKKK